MKWKNRGIIIVTVALLIIDAAVGVYNIRTNSKFWDTSFSQVFTLIVAVLIAFIATQFKNDYRKNKDNAEIILRKIQTIVTDDSFFVFKSSDDVTEVNKRISMMVRKLNNISVILLEYGKRLGFKENAQYIDQQIKEYRETVSEHISDLDYLEKTESTFKRLSVNIDSKCDNIILNLYK